MTDQPKCKDRIRAHYGSRMADLRAMVKAEREGNEAGPEDTGPLNEYGLCFDYVAPETFKGQRRGYWRYQLSWGGPSDEFRFYAERSGVREDAYTVEKVEYWFLDWWDGAHRTLRQGRDFDFLCDLFRDFAECGTVAHAYSEAIATE